MTKRLAMTGLLPGHKYAVQVRTNEAGQPVGDWSQTLEFYTIDDNVPPEPPTLAFWESVGTSFIGTWTSPDLTHAANYDFSNFEVRITSGTDVVTYGVKGATRFDFTFEMNVSAFGTPRPVLGFEVCSMDNVGNRSAYTPIITATNPIPQEVDVDVIAGVESIQLIATPSTVDTDIKGYAIYMSQIEGFTPDSSNRVYVETPSWTLTTGSFAPWYFHVRAVDVFDQESPSTEITGTARSVIGSIDLTPPDAPSDVHVTAGYNNTAQKAFFDVTWSESPSTDIGGYIVRYTTDGTNYYYQTASGTSARIDVEPGITYTVGVAARDFAGNVSGYVDAAPIASISDTTAPSTPAAPIASGNTMALQVTHDNTKATGGAIEPDTAYYNVYASKTSGFTAGTANYLGKLIRSTTTSGVFPIPATGGSIPDQWYVKVKAVDRSGNESSASAQATATPNLISNANIIDATIESAKIVNLSADKLTAGSGIIDDLKIGNGTVNSGSLSSSDYIAGVQGWKIGYDKTLPSGARSVFEINQGLIRASALELKNSFNVMPWAYSTFEYRANFFDNLSKTNCNAVVNTSVPDRVGQTQSLKVTATTTSNRVYLGVLATDYNIRAEAGKPYIVSYWAKTDTGTKTLTARLTSSTGTTYDAPAQTVTTAWTRYSAVLTPAATGSVLSFSSAEVGSYFLDAIQVEEKIGSLSTPTSYNPPSLTSIDAGVITTGSIQSTSTSTVGGITLPAWYIDMAGGAQFTDARVLGTLTVGGNNIAGSGSDTANSFIKSENFSNFPGSEAGWRIDGDGDAIFNSATIRGTLQTALVAGDLTLTGGAIRTSAAVNATSATAPGIYFDSGNFDAYGAFGAIIDAVLPYDSRNHFGVYNNSIYQETYEVQDYDLDFTTTPSELVVQNMDGKYLRGSALSGHDYGSGTYTRGFTVDFSGNTYEIDVTGQFGSATVTVRNSVGTFVRRFNINGYDGLNFTSVQIDPVFGSSLWYQTDDTNRTIYQYSTTGTLQASYSGLSVNSFAVGYTGIWSADTGNILNLRSKSTFAVVSSVSPIYSIDSPIKTGTDGKVYFYSADNSFGSVLSYQVHQYDSLGAHRPFVSVVPQSPTSLYNDIWLDSNNNVLVLDKYLFTFKTGYAKQLDIDTTAGSSSSNSMVVDGVLEAGVIKNNTIETNYILSDDRFKVDAKDRIYLSAESSSDTSYGAPGVTIDLFADTEHYSRILTGGDFLIGVGGEQGRGGVTLIGDGVHLQAHGPGGTGIVDVTESFYVYTSGVSGPAMYITTGGGVFMPAMGTTSLGANVNWTSGRLRGVSSSSAYKSNVTPLEMNPTDILKAEPVKWHDKQELDRWNNLEAEEGESNLVHPRWIPGVIAEQLEEAGLGLFVTYDLDGTVTGVAYDRLIAAVLPLLKDHNDRITALEANGSVV